MKKIFSENLPCVEQAALSFPKEPISIWENEVALICLDSMPGILEMQQQTQT